MKKSDKEKTLFGLILFLVVIASLLVGVVSAAKAEEEIVIDTEKGVPGF